MTPIEEYKALIRARDRNLGNPCMGAYARDARGKNIRSDAPEAISWCATGACMREGVTTAWLWNVSHHVRTGVIMPSPGRINDAYPDRLEELWARAIALQVTERGLPDLDDFPGELP